MTVSPVLPARWPEDVARSDRAPAVVRPGEDLENRLLSLEVGGAERAGPSRSEALAWLQVVPPQQQDLVRRLELVLARSDTRLGRFAEGVAAVAEIRQWAVAHGARLVQARAEREQAGLLRRAGETASGLEHAFASLSLLVPADPVLLRADHLLCLADSLAVAGAREESLGRYDEALALADGLGDGDLTLLVINNLAYTYYELDRIDDALPLCDRMVRMGAVAGALPPFAVSTLAEVYVAGGLPQRAEEVLRTVVLDETTEAEDYAEHLLARARVERALGRHTEARALVAQSLEAAAGHGLGDHEGRAMREQSEISAEMGDFERAYRELSAYHVQCVHHFTVAAQTRARMVQAIAEVREQSDTYRELSYRDALTGLHNRRFVDENLDKMVTDAHASARPLSVAFIDVDHFKLVNDTWSHDVGDQVLTAIGQLLLAAIAAVPGAVAARMGGEEFLVVLPGFDQDAAHTRLELFRATIGAHQWSSLAPGLATTVSVGLALLAPHCDSRADLLGAADRRLYRAKAAGRNRIVSSG